MKKLVALGTTLMLAASIAGSAVAQNTASPAPAGDKPAVAKHQGNAAKRPGGRLNGLWQIMKRAQATDADVTAVKDFLKEKAAAHQAYEQAVRTPLSVLRKKNATDADYASSANAVAAARTTYVTRVTSLQQALFAKLSARGKVAVYMAEAGAKIGRNPKKGVSPDAAPAGPEAETEGLGIF